ncbi:RagB/SusD family nutrient uptake outer membrane protein [Sphingobacterium sp. E70]|uniref:RagB/SusD family nutrient uptake outer membrane protein n=1 Tax=Sphingobacterium sp. E70 TaxID=2853439 RepID=UPI00211C479A|nr:RagB/SusD family nutrient uptake outer membrane protein [Sphingobacterium sp. E70]ULT23671.1 RagB/SusD family nutrient uptake outer membrane protein [Sphingobacterium sp. E70]
MKIRSIYRYHRNRSLYFLVSMLVAGLTSSCNKQLDELRPHNVIFEDIQFERPEGYSKAVVGAYNLVAGGAVASSFNYNDMLIFLSEAKGNTIRALDAEVNKNTDVFNYINSSTKDRSHSYEFWRGSYTVLLHLNKILGHVKDTETNAEILQAKAEALFLRAYVYFNLVRLYGKPYHQSPGESLG